jgi:uncharacterized protein YktA (UPF0223 family)
MYAYNIFKSPSKSEDKWIIITFNNMSSYLYNFLT